MSQRSALGLALPIALAWSAGAAAQGPPVFASRVEAVYLDVVVTRSGRPMPGLGAGNFELKDDGVVQRLELLSAETRPLRAVLVFDTSSSVEGERLGALRSAGEAFLDGLRPGDQAGLVAFSEEIAWLAAPTTDRSVLRHALAGLHAGGASSVLDALFTAITLTEAESRPLVVLFTDGEDNTSWLGEGQLKASVERSSAVVHVIAWQQAPVMVRGKLEAPPVESEQERALREIAEASGGRAWHADSPSRLREAFTAIADAMGHRYVLRYEPEGVGHPGFHRLEIALRSAKGDVQARRGYWVSEASDQRAPKR